MGCVACGNVLHILVRIMAERVGFSCHRFCYLAVMPTLA